MSGPLAQLSKIDFVRNLLILFGIKLNSTEFSFAGAAQKLLWSKGGESNNSILAQHSYVPNGDS